MAVVVVNYGSSKLLETNLVELSRSCEALRCVVVDNYSSDAERVEIEQLARSEEWTLITSSTNVGFGAGANRGVERAIADGARTLLLLNPDASITCESLERIRRHLAANPRSLVSPRVDRPDGAVWFRGGTLEMDRGRTRSRPVHPGAPDEVPWLSGACLATTAATWRELGGFDLDYFLYWEDVDLSVRATAAGIDLRVLDDVVATHDEGGTQERSSSDFSWDYYFFNIRNRLLYAYKHLDDRTLRKWLAASPRQSYLILLRGGGRKKFLRSWRPWQCLVRGLYDGWRDGRRARTSTRMPSSPLR
jgi:GT2 family glycosyltransferase